ncbi:OLC1v1029693C1 [Oldenlandia corymbosa var. corymbosa]|uniref:OLC1v1029693C1 n=1 Tax=Oldenlandia corymbosa var. corymbosa TaxID=529605 RepID=A0AAV1CHG5_OLDCO|nr:OLC1v1029693C1 [Oldenlandia corymbosa var. corymbosa]
MELVILVFSSGRSFGFIFGDEIVTLMGKGRPRAVEKGVLGPSTGVLSDGSLNIPSGPVYYPTEDEFKDPLEFIDKIRPEAEKYGICKIVPPQSWKPPFALDVDSFTFPTKTQAIHQLQARCPPCDPKTFRLEYIRFLEDHCGKKAPKRVVFEGQDLDLCKLFNAVKRYGGYDNVVKNKKWGDVFRFVRPSQKMSECAKHVLSQLYIEHLCDYEEYYNKISKGKYKACKRGIQRRKNCGGGVEFSSSKRRRKNKEGDKVEVGKLKEEVHDQICEQCSSGLHGEVMLLCDRCNKGWHMHCLSPPLKQVPVGNWYCLDCVNSEKDSFGFVPGKEFSLEAFRRVAERAKKKWFGSTVTSRVQLEKKFWEIVEGSVGEVEVMYGSDLDTSVYGSGFPRVKDQRPSSVEVDVWDEYCASPWNLNNLPKLPGSMLRAVHHGIAGVMVPWLYIGMLFSSFCWHFEDHCFYSMNYHHWGEPKCWYSVPGSEADAFEKVMRNSLPDLFDAQPDLLFQLVTMLNPSVLQDSGVPVYSLLQEPGNFIVTFPRSYHGGFNLGLNCAEAVNFAPADWLPHGGFGAELYQLYHKPAVLSHEELLCVVAKSDFHEKASMYLRMELLRIYEKEKTWRERLWKNGTVFSSPMQARKSPEHVGSEEDPTCIICQQLLYLAAVVCRCRPSSHVCLEHSEHLCECKPYKHRLLYRHTLAELEDLVLRTGKIRPGDQVNELQGQRSCFKDSVPLSKKVKGGVKTHAKLAEDWVLNFNKIFEKPYSRDSFASALKEAQQFLWAGSEMDPVRNAVKKLIQSQNWAEAVRSSVSKLESWSRDPQDETGRVHMDHVDELLSQDPVPCNEPCHLKLKEYQKKGKLLISEIEEALLVTSTVSIADWESLYAKSRSSPIYVKESEKLFQKLTKVKVWVENVRKCTNKKSDVSVEADVLYRLQAELLELEVQLPEGELLLDLISQVESCRSRCCELLKDSICLQKLQLHIREYNRFTVDVPELKLLREHYHDAISWKSRVNHILANINCREDQENVVNELTSIQSDGLSLKVEVEELPHIGIELKKACCRVKGLKALESKMTLDFLEQLIAEANVLQIEKEKLFVDISEALAVAMVWEERAQEVLSNEAKMSEFEDILRTSEEIIVCLPSLNDVTNAFSMANTWLSKTRPFLFPDFSVSPVSTSLLKLDTLKELVSESKLLKICLRERGMLQRVLENYTKWEANANSFLDDTVSLLDDNVGLSTECLVLKIKHQLSSLESIVEAGLSFRLEFALISKLQDACSTLRWCFKALAFCDLIPTFQEVEASLKLSSQLPGTYASCILPTTLLEGMKWLNEALKVLPPCSDRQIKLIDADKILEMSQKLCISFPLMAGQVQIAIEKHNLWLEQVALFFKLNHDERSWAKLLHLKEIGVNTAFNCSERDMVLSEVQKVERWKQNLNDTVGISAGDGILLNTALLEIKDSLDRSLAIYDKSKSCRTEPSLCVSCSMGIDDQKLAICNICKDCFHLQCIGAAIEDANCGTTTVCHYCNFIRSGKISGYKCGVTKTRPKIPDLNKLKVLLSDAERLCLWIEERSILHQIVEKAVKCSACFMEIVDLALSYQGSDLWAVAGKVVTALKATNTAEVHDALGDSKFELVLARNSWKVRAQKLLQSSQKPTMQQVQRHVKECQVICIPPDDYFRLKLTEARHIGLQWADTAKKVSIDGGALALDKVFELIEEGENLPLVCEKELKMLGDRSMLYCICRRPYDQRPMIACDNCDEWYHFDCIKLSSPPKVYICPACDSHAGQDLLSMPRAQERSTSAKVQEPQTPSPRRSDLRKRSRTSKSVKRKGDVVVRVDGSSHPRDMERLLWRNRKPFRRLARKRANFESLTPFFYVRVDDSQ